MYAICNLNIVPVREENSHKSELITQLLYGETCFIIREEQNWAYIRADFDQCEGWIRKNQVQEIDEETHSELMQEIPLYCGDFLSAVTSLEDERFYQPITLGATISSAEFLGHIFMGEKPRGTSVVTLLQLAQLYENAPYLWGGKTPFGIDSSGLTQMVYKMLGVRLPRFIEEQSRVGILVEKDAEIKIGDLAFFENQSGQVNHAGIILPDLRILHAFERVRIDYLTDVGIYNEEWDGYTHKLHSIRRFLD